MTMRSSPAADRWNGEAEADLVGIVANPSPQAAREVGERLGAFCCQAVEYGVNDPLVSLREAFTGVLAGAACFLCRAAEGKLAASVTAELIGAMATAFWEASAPIVPTPEQSARGLTDAEATAVMADTAVERAREWARAVFLQMAENVEANPGVVAQQIAPALAADTVRVASLMGATPEERVALEQRRRIAFEETYASLWARSPIPPNPPNSLIPLTGSHTLH